MQRGGVAGWVVAGILGAAFVIYALLDQKLNWIAFGRSYELQQAQMAREVSEAFRGLDARIKKLEPQPGN